MRLDYVSYSSAISTNKCIFQAKGSVVEQLTNIFSGIRQCPGNEGRILILPTPIMLDHMLASPTDFDGFKVEPFGPICSLRTIILVLVLPGHAK
jgi:hypothetical protein